MRLHTATTVALSSLCLIVWMCDLSFAQQWSVDLYDIDVEDPAGIVDQTRAESVEFMPDGKMLVTAGFFYNGGIKESVGEVRLWNVVDGSMAATLVGSAVSYALRSGSLAITSTGDRIAAAGRTTDNDWVIDVFDPKYKRLVRTLKGDPHPVVCVAFSPDGNILAAAHMNGTVELWNHHKGKLFLSFSAHNDGVTPIAFSPDGKLLATGNGDGSISFWNPKNAERCGGIPAQAELEFPGALVFSHDGKFLASGGFPRQKNSPIHVWELTGLVNNGGQVAAKRRAKFEGHREHTYALAFSPDGRTLASANQDTTARVWDVAMNKQLTTITDHVDFVYDVAWSPNGRTLATLGRDSLKLWTMEQINQKK
jgi:WD40 repeat protein